MSAQRHASLVRIVSFVLVCLVTAIVAADARATADDSGAAAAALLAKHAAYAGWRGGDGSIKTLRETGEVTRDGKVVRNIRRLQMGAIYRTSSAVGSESYDNGFTGRVFWHTNGNGFTTRSAGEIVKYFLTWVQIDDEELTGLAGIVRGTESINGVTATDVRVVAAAGLPIDLWIDPATGAFKRITVDPDGKYEQRIDVLADTDVGKGKLVRSAWRFAGDPTVFRYTEIDANAPISLDELHPPKPVATWTFGPPAQTVPIAVDDKRIFIDAVVNGHPGRFVFDTGAAQTAITDSFARTVGARRRGETAIFGIGGGARAHIYRIDTLAIGPNTLHDLDIVTGLDERENRGEHVDGYIGFDLLAGSIVDMDLDAKTMRILDPALVAPDRGAGITLNVDLSTNHPRLQMTVGGKTPVIATLDSGNFFYVLISSKLVAENHVKFFSPPDSLAARLRFEGVNGSEVDQCGQLNSLELGPIAYRPVPACISESMADNAVLVGFDFFRAFNYVFDYPDGEMLVSPRKNP